MVRPAPKWAQGIMSYMEDGELPDDEVLARQIQRRSKAYIIFQGELHRKSPTTILQRCVETEEGGRILQDVHGGDCGHHASSRYLVAKIFRYGFYWPTALRQAEEIVQKCEGCQRFANKTHMPASALKTIPIIWPFAVWCLDMVGPFMDPGLVTSRSKGRTSTQSLCHRSSIPWAWYSRICP